MLLLPIPNSLTAAPMSASTHTNKQQPENPMSWPHQHTNEQQPEKPKGLSWPPNTQTSAHTTLEETPNSQPPLQFQVSFRPEMKQNRMASKQDSPDFLGTPIRRRLWGSSFLSHLKSLLLQTRQRTRLSNLSPNQLLSLAFLIELRSLAFLYCL